MTADKRQVADQIGRHLFGRAARLRIALWVRHEPGRFWQQRVADGARVRPQYVRGELAHLAALGMVEPIDNNDPGDPRNFYRRVEHPLWDVIDHVHDALDTLTEPGDEPHLQSINGAYTATRR